MDNLIVLQLNYAVRQLNFDVFHLTIEHYYWRIDNSIQLFSHLKKKLKSLKHLKIIGQFDWYLFNESKFRGNWIVLSRSSNINLIEFIIENKCYETTNWKVYQRKSKRFKRILSKIPRNNYMHLKFHKISL